MKQKRDYIKQRFGKGKPVQKLFPNKLNEEMAWDYLFYSYKANLPLTNNYRKELDILHKKVNVIVEKELQEKFVLKSNRVGLKYYVDEKLKLRLTKRELLSVLEYVSRELE